MRATLSLLGGGGVDVFGLSQARHLVLVALHAAEEDSAAHGEDGGSPAEPVRPGVGVVALEDFLVELHRIDDERDKLSDHWMGREEGKP